MASNRLKHVIQHLRTATLHWDGAGLSDGQLLERYVHSREEAAFAALLHRHGPMVWGVCLRILHSYHDAEDAFQATFLVLVRKAASIMPKEMVGNWLYGVAHQTAMNARVTAAKRKRREQQMMEMPKPVLATRDPWLDLLDQELSRLPAKYRAVIVLCDLEGRTRKQVAQQLNVPEGTVASRLATARLMLKKRLTRHGLAVSAGALAAMLSQKVGSAGLPVSVASSTIKIASLSASGAIPLHIAALTEGVLKVMFLMKLKTTMATLVLVGVSLVLLAGVVSNVTSGGQPAPVDAVRHAQVAQPQPQQKQEKPVYEPLPQPKPERTPSARTNLTLVEIRGEGSEVVQKAMRQGRLQVAQTQGRIRVLWDGDKNQLNELEATAKALREGRLEVQQPDTFSLSTPATK